MPAEERESLGFPPVSLAAFFAAFFAACCAASFSAVLAGCASPGAPRPPSLQLPQIPSDLSASRSGPDVALRFTLPAHTTDGLLLKRTPLQVRFCRQERAGQPCIPVPETEVQDELQFAADRQGLVVERIDRLPAFLVTGPGRAVIYRVEVQNAQGRSAGPSDPVYVAAGTPPPPVEQLRATPTRRGVLLQWAPVANAGEVLLDRQERQRPQPGASVASVPAPSHRPTHAQGRHVPGAHKAGSAPSSVPGELWLQADPGSTNSSETMDGTAEPDIPYTYRAVRRLTVEIGGRALEMRSALSDPVEVQWAAIYPPDAPSDLTAAGFRSSASGAEGAPGAYAVDLIWQPVDDPHVVGYLVSRTALNADGTQVATAERLTASPVRSPAFHDGTALAGVRYRYDVQAVDARGNRSASASTTVEAARQ